MLGVEEDVFAPEAVDDLFAGDDGALPFGEQEEELERNAFGFRSVAVALQLEAFAVEFEFSEMNRRPLACSRRSPRAKNYSIAGNM